MCGNASRYSSGVKVNSYWPRIIPGRFRVRTRASRQRQRRRARACILITMENFLNQTASKKYASTSVLSTSVAPEPNLAPWQNLFGSFAFYFV